MTIPLKGTGKSVLMIAHVAGMIDLVALPVWIGALMQHYQYAPQQAGLMVTCFLGAVVLASMLLAPCFNRMPRKMAATLGFALAALAFFLAARQPIDNGGFGVLALLHVLGGLGVGCGLSVTHGTIGRSTNPHRLFAVAGATLGVFAVVFLAGVPQLIIKMGPAVMFVAFGALMAIAAVAALIAFPESETDPNPALAERPSQPIPLAAWLITIVVICLTLNQAMIFSFMERMGAERGFSVAQINGVLIAVGLVNLLPSLLAAMLQKKWAPANVALVGPIIQATLGCIIASSTQFMPYAFASAVYVSIAIFTHNFLFGLVARLDPSGRAVAATPAMMMLGSAIGPALGGGIVHASGYDGLAWGAVCVGAVSFVCMLLVRRQLGAQRHALVGAEI